MPHDPLQSPLVPAILIEMHEGRWRATAVIANDGEAIDVHGPSSALSLSPTEALAILLGRHFGRSIGDDIPASMIVINRDAEVAG